MTTVIGWDIGGLDAALARRRARVAVGGTGGLCPAGAPGAYGAGWSARPLA